MDALGTVDVTDPMVITTTVVFVLTYIALAIGSVPGLRIDRAGISVVGAAAMLVIGSISFPDAMRETDWATIVILFSLMVIVAQLTESGLLAKFASKVVPEKLSPRLTLAPTMAATAFLAAARPLLLFCDAHKGRNMCNRA